MGLSGALAAVPIPATHALLEANPQVQGRVAEGRLVSLYGVPFELNPNPCPGPGCTSTDQFVSNFIAQDGNAFGVTGVDLELKSAIDTRGNKFRVYTYVQKIEGLPVHGSLVKIPVLRGNPEKISYVGIRLVPHPEGQLPGDNWTAQDAIDTVAGSAEYGHLTNFPDAADVDHVIYEDSDQTLHRAWRFHGGDDDEAYLFFVGTNSKDILDAQDQVFHATVSGTVEGYATPCFPPDHGTYPNVCPADNPDNEVTNPCPELTALGDIKVSIDIPDVEVEPVYAREDGYYEFTDLPPDVLARVTTSLVGQWVTVNTKAEGESNLLPDEPYWEGMTSNTLPATGVDFTFNPNEAACNPWPREFDTAQVNVFLGVEATHDWFKDLQPNFSGIDANLGCSVNLAEYFDETCNGRYVSGVGSIIFLASNDDDGCNNWAFRSVIAHEYGHFIVDRLLGDPGWPFHEGFADAVGTLALDSPLMSFDAFRNNEATRNIDDDFVLAWEGCGQDEYCKGRPISGAFWDLQKEFNCCGEVTTGSCEHPLTVCTVEGAECGSATCIEKKGLRCCEDGAAPGRCASPVTACIDSSECAGGAACIDRPTDELFADFALITHGRLGQRMLTEVLIADDDDGNLTSVPKTPHYDQIIHSFVNLHGWAEDSPCTPPTTGVVVKWDGVPDPPVGPKPQLDVDYFVDYFWAGPVCLPHVTLVTTEVEVSGFDYPVTYWYVGRVDPASLDPLDLGAVLANWGSPAHNIVVNVGTDLDGDVACRDVYVVDIPAQSPQHWSSIVLQLGGVCDAASGDNAGKPCDLNADCSPGLCSVGNLQRTCFRGNTDGANCVDDSPGCGGALSKGTCAAGHLRVRALAYPAEVGTCDGGTSHGGPCDPEGNPAQECPDGGTCEIKGGRISGTLAGVGHRVFAEGIGIGSGEDSGPGALQFKRGFNNMILGTVPSGWQVITETIGMGFPDGGLLRIRGELGGDVNIEGDLDYFVQVLGTGSSGGNISINGNLTGEVNVAGELDSDGTIHVVGGVHSGRITVSGSGVSGGDILVDGNIQTGGSIVINGTLDGDVCAANLTPGGPLPIYVSVGQFGDNGTICGKRLGLASPKTPAGAEGYVKNRYLSFVPGFPGTARKFRVTLVSLPAPFDYLNGQKMWVGDPVEICENSGQDSTVPPENCGNAGEVPNPTFWGANLVCDYGSAALIDEATVGVLHIYDDEIVPGATYEVQAFLDGGDPLNEDDFSFPIQITGPLWGDVCGYTPAGACTGMPDGVADVVNDVLGVLGKFGNLNALHKARADLARQMPDLKVEVATDVLRCLDAFGGVSYPFAEPAPCP